MKDLEKLEAGWSYKDAVERVKPMVVNWAKKNFRGGKRALYRTF